MKSHNNKIAQKTEDGIKWKIESNNSKSLVRHLVLGRVEVLIYHRH